MQEFNNIPHSIYGPHISTTFDFGITWFFAGCRSLGGRLTNNSCSTNKMLCVRFVSPFIPNNNYHNKIQECYFRLSLTPNWPQFDAIREHPQTPPPGTCDLWTAPHEMVCVSYWEYWERLMIPPIQNNSNPVTNVPTKHQLQCFYVPHTPTLPQPIYWGCHHNFVPGAQIRGNWVSHLSTSQIEQQNTTK